MNKRRERGHRRVFKRGGCGQVDAVHALQPVLQLDAGEGVHPGLRHDILRHDAQSGDGADDTQDIFANLFDKNTTSIELPIRK